MQWDHTYLDEQVRAFLNPLSVLTFRAVSLVGWLEKAPVQSEYHGGLVGLAFTAICFATQGKHGSHVLSCGAG